MFTAFKLLKNNTAIHWAAGSWSLFIAENYILSENRPILLSPQLLDGNEDYYHYLYGLCSTAAVGSIIYGYQYKVKNQGPMLWKVTNGVPLGGRIMGFVCLSMGLGFLSQTAPKLQIPVEYLGGGDDDSVSSSGSSGSSISSSSSSGNRGVQEEGIVVGVETKTEEEEDARQRMNNTNRRWKVRCPFDFTDSKSKLLQSNQEEGKAVSIYGMDRITRHPGLWSFGLVGMGLSFLTPSVPTRVWLCMPMMVALIGGEHTDSRHRRGMGGTLSQGLDDVTSNVPFWAIVSGKQGHVWDVIVGKLGQEVKGWNALLAMGMAASIVASRGRAKRHVNPVVGVVASGSAGAGAVARRG